MLQEHLLTFEQQWTDAQSGRTLPKFVLEELHKFMACGILARGLAHLFCDDCGEHYVTAFSCKARAVCPSCLGRRMSAGAADLVDNVLPDVPIRQFVLTLPFPLRFPLAFDGKLLGDVLRIFTDTVATWYRKRRPDLPVCQTGAVTAIQRASSDLRCTPHFHTYLCGIPVDLDAIDLTPSSRLGHACGLPRSHPRVLFPDGHDGAVVLVRHVVAHVVALIWGSPERNATSLSTSLTASGW